MTATNRLIVLFFEQVPNNDEAIAACATIEPEVKKITLARRDKHSERASMWTRDPIDCLPNGRLAIDLSVAPTSHEALKAIGESLGGASYCCFGRTPLEPTLSVGGTFPGTLQLCCFRRKEGLNDAALEDLWFTHHTSVALSTQQSFGYRQNRVLESGSPYFDGIVEEYFSEAAATDMTAFFADGHDETRMWQHIEALTKSSESFLDLNKSEVIHLTDTRLR